MARVRMVTRTIETAVLDIMCLDTDTAAVSVVTFKTEPSDDVKMLKDLKKIYETDTFKLVAIQSKSMETALYGMPETEFMQYAKLLPPR